MWEELRPSRVKVLHTYTKRAIRWRKNSSPYVSGDLFSDMSDISMFPPKYRGKQPSLREISEARVIFCPSNRLDEFLAEFNSRINARVIICGNSDFEFHYVPKQLPGSVKHLFLQNSFVSDGALISTLPIGIENLRWGVNGNPKYLKTQIPWENRRAEVLIGPFGLTHPTRLEIRNKFSQGVNGAHLISERCSPQRYAEISSGYRFIGAARGNGVDTHRLWETLYRGSIPLVQSDNWTAGLRSLNLPLVEIPSWDEEAILEIVESPINRGFDPKKIEPLWWPFWKKMISNYL